MSGKSILSGCCAETEAVDLLLEVEELGWLEQYIDEENYRRTCLYLTSTSAYLPEPDDKTVLHTAYSIYMKVGQHGRCASVCQRSHSFCNRAIQLKIDTPAGNIYT